MVRPYPSSLCCWQTASVATQSLSSQQIKSYWIELFWKTQREDHKPNMKSYIIKTLINWLHIHIDGVLVMYCSTYKVWIKMRVHCFQWVEWKAGVGRNRKNLSCYQNFKLIFINFLKYFVDFLFSFLFIYVQFHISNYLVRKELQKYVWNKKKVLAVFMIWFTEDNTRNLMGTMFSHEISNQFHRQTQSE